MSGIYGVHRYHGAPVDPRWLERMKAAMAHYGPCGIRGPVDGPVGMGTATVSWSGIASALLALTQGRPLTALRLLFQGGPNLRLLLKRPVLKPLLTPGRRLVRRLAGSHS